jgi:gamma-glutamylcysteine synthetase
MGENAQQTSHGPPQPWPSMCAVLTTVVDFLDQQCGIAAARACTTASIRCDWADREAMRSADVSRHEAEIAIHLARHEVLDVKLVRLGRMHLMFLSAKNTSRLAALRRALMNWSSIGS